MFNDVVLMQSYLVSCEQVSINPLLQSGDLRLLRSQQVSTGKDFESVKEWKRKHSILYFSSFLRFWLFCYLFNNFHFLGDGNIMGHFTEAFNMRLIEGISETIVLEKDSEYKCPNHNAPRLKDVLDVEFYQCLQYKWLTSRIYVTKYT